MQAWQSLLSKVRLRDLAVKRYTYLFLILGLLFLVFLIRKLGAHELWDCFHRLGWKIFIPILIFVPHELLRSFSWRRVLLTQGVRVPFATLYKIRLAGESVNSLTPLNFAGGDPFKAWILSSHQFPGGSSVTSIVIERTLQTLATVLIICSGTLAGVWVLPIDHETRVVLLSALSLLFLGMLALAFLKKRGLFQTLSSMLHFFRLRRAAAKVREKLLAQDEPIRGFYAKHQATFVFCLLLHILAKSLSIVEITVVGRMLGVPMSLWQALFIASVIPVTNIAAAFIPGSLGVLEGVMGGVFHSLNWNPALGVSLQLIRRIRQIFYVTLGFLLFHFSLRKKTVAVAERLAESTT